MKKILILLLSLCIMFNAFTQVPAVFKYQSVLRKSDGSPLINQSVSLKISILGDSVNGPALYSETQSTSTNALGLISLNIGLGSVNNGSINSIDWSKGIYFMKIELDETGGSNYSFMGVNQLLSVPFAMYANKTNTNAKFEITETNQSSPDSALFEVKDKLGNVVFAVYEGGAELIVNPAVKGARTGFSVGGRSTTKGSMIDNILTITPDSVRIYIDNSLTKGAKGGFAVGGRTASKGIHPEYLHVTQDSSRIYTTDSVAGFGVGNLNGNSTTSYMHLNAFNYFIGQNSGDHVTQGIPQWYNGNFNSTLGYQSGMSLTEGFYDVLIGYQTGKAITSGYRNTGIGASSLLSTTTGVSNTAIGSEALNYNTTGSYNSSFGDISMNRNTTGSQNTAAGWYSLTWDTSGNYNSAFGVGSLQDNSSGDGNTAVGVNTMTTNTTGDYNTVIGYQADVNSNNLTNATAIGANAIVDASNKVVIGDGNVTSIGGYAAFSNFSDRRLKENILYQDRLGLNFINKLHTASYYYKADKNKHRRDGLIAQDVQEALNDLGLEFSGLIVDTDTAKTLNLSYSEFVLPLINSVQELNRQNDELMKRNLQLENDIREIKEMLKEKSADSNK